VTRLAARVLLVALAVLAGTPAISAAAGYTPFRQPTGAGAVASATFERSTRLAKITLRSGHTALLRGIHPIFAKASRPVHHRLRYIAAGLVVVLLLIGGGVWLYTRGARANSGDGPKAPAPPDT